MSWAQRNRRAHKRHFRVIPTHYTSKEGGVWRPWNGGYVIVGTALQLRSTDTVRINKVPAVHSLKFSDNMVWDCINGIRPFIIHNGKVKYR